MIDRTSRRLLFGLVFLVTITAVVLNWRIFFPPSATPIPNTKKEEPFEFLSQHLATVNRPPFVGPSTCAECHAAIHRSFLGTKHPRTLREVKKEDMPDGFANDNEFTSRDGNIRFAMTKESEKFYQNTHVQSPSAQPFNRASLDLVLGSGGVADDIFLHWQDEGWMHELPMVWLYPQSQWSASHFDPNSQGHFGRLLTLRCIECHSTWVHHVPGTANQYLREGKILGVTCESCHGPGEQHVIFHREHSDQKKGSHIVLPSSLSRERQIEVCTQCHSNAMKHLGPAFSYRPGEPLDHYYKTVTTHATEDDRVANQITYLRQSKCFIADTKMTCITCHNPHQANNSTNSGSSSCAKCHQKTDCLDRPNLPAEVQDDCVSCHMPSYLKININFQTKNDDYVPPLRRTEHHIASHRHARQETLFHHYRKQQGQESQAKADALQAEIVKHFQLEADACRKSYRFLGVIAALREVVRIHDTQDSREALRQAVQFQAELDKLSTDAQKQLMQNNPQAAMVTFQRLLHHRPNDANAHGRLGTEYAKIGNRELASFHWSAVAQHDPNDAYGLGMMAWQAFLDRRDAESIQLYLQAEQIEPRQAKMKYQMGLVYTRLNRLPEAIAKFKEAVAIEPRHVEALQAVVFACLDAGMAKDAISYAEFVVRETKLQDAHSLLMLANVYQAAGHLKNALQSLKLARQYAIDQAPDKIAEIEMKTKSLELAQ